MANRRDRGGGLVFIGVDHDYLLTGVSSVEDAQQQIADWASQVYSVPLRVAFEVLHHEGREVLAVIVPACPSGHRPCHFQRRGPYAGSWIRVGNSTRLMTPDEVRREIASDEVARGSTPPFDAIPYLQAGLETLDDGLIDTYVRGVMAARPESRIGSLSRDEVLRSIGAVAEQDGRWHPTPTGLLFFCREPQRYLPQSSVEFLHLWGPDLTSLGPDESRWRVNREFFGPLPDIIVGVETMLLERIATRGIVDGFRRRDEPEYPRFALRELIVNAVAHRDYTMRGSRIQVRLYPDRIEIHTPGGLPAPVTVDNIEDEQATRNESVVRMLQDHGYMERRGYGFNGVVAAMRQAGLAPPLLRDDGASFDVCLKSHVLMSPESLEWLQQFQGHDLSPQERLALVYLRVNDRLYNRDYARLADCTSVEATQALRRMVERGLVTMRGTRGGAYYVLPEAVPEPPTGLRSAEPTDEERILALARREGRVTRGMCMIELDASRWRAYSLLKQLVDDSRLQPHGKGRWRYYTPQ